MQNSNVTNGQHGVVNLNGTNSWTQTTGQAPARYLQVLEAATFTTLTDLSAVAGTDALTGFSIPAGTILEGRFTAVTKSAGKVRLYLAAN